jgi:hypothetical protein
MIRASHASKSELVKRSGISRAARYFQQKLPGRIFFAFHISSHPILGDKNSQWQWTRLLGSGQPAQALNEQLLLIQQAGIATTP